MGGTKRIGKAKAGTGGGGGAVTSVNGKTGAVTGLLEAANNLSDMSTPPVENQILYGNAINEAESSTDFLWDNTNSIFTVKGGQAIKRTNVADADYTVLRSDYEISVTGITAHRTITLPDPSIAKQQVFILSLIHI